MFNTDPPVAGEYLTIYRTGLLDGTAIPPQVAIGDGWPDSVFWQRSRIPWPKPSNARMPSGIVPGPAIPVRLNYLGRPSNVVTIGVR
jgi:hypothetical protein